MRSNTIPLGSAIEQDTLSMDYDKQNTNARRGMSDFGFVRDDSMDIYPINRQKSRRYAVEPGYDSNWNDVYNRRSRVVSASDSQRSSLLCHEDRSRYTPSSNRSSYHFDATYNSPIIHSDTNSSYPVIIPASIHRSRFRSDQITEESRLIPHEVYPPTSNQDGFVSGNRPGSCPTSYYSYDGTSNSVMENTYPTTEVPIIFHQGKGIRESIRIGNDQTQDLSRLTTVSRRGYYFSNHCSSNSSVDIPIEHPIQSSSSLSHNSIPIDEPEEQVLKTQSFHNSVGRYSPTHFSSPSHSTYTVSVSPPVIAAPTPLSYEVVEVANEPPMHPLVKDEKRFYQYNHLDVNDSIISSSGHKHDTKQTKSTVSQVKLNPCLSYLLQFSSSFDFNKLVVTMNCSNCELNPHATPNAKLCYDFLNTGVCKREQTTGICNYRHLPNNHIDAVIDRIQSGKMRISLIQQKDNHYVIADMPGYSSQYPGELNPSASIDADICLEYCLTGKCSRQEQNKKCPLRHLFYCHPERIAILYLHNKLSEREASVWNLSPCSENEVNPFSNPKEKLCFDYTNLGYCKRNRNGKICRFRHLLYNHQEAVKDRSKMNDHHAHYGK